MRAPALHDGPGRPEIHAELRPGRRDGVASLLMLVVEAALVVPLTLVGSALQSALGLGDEELLVEAGAWGWVAAVLMVALLAAAPVVGIVLGLRARRLGAHRLGTLGVAANATIGAYLVAVSTVQLLLA